MLNSYYTTPVSPPSTDMEQPAVRLADTVFRFRPVDEEDVLQALEGLNTRKATGVDGVSVLLLKTVAEVITPSITKIFNDSITIGQVLKQWEKATVTNPLSKKCHLISGHFLCSL